MGVTSPLHFPSSFLCPSPDLPLSFPLLTGKTATTSVSFHDIWASRHFVGLSSTLIHTTGCNFVKIFATPGWRNRSQIYSRQYHFAHGVWGRRISTTVRIRLSTSTFPFVCISFRTRGVWVRMSSESGRNPNSLGQITLIFTVVVVLGFSFHFAHGVYNRSRPYLTLPTVHPISLFSQTLATLYSVFSTFHLAGGSKSLFAMWIISRYHG